MELNNLPQVTVAWEVQSGAVDIWSYGLAVYSMVHCQLQSVEYLTAVRVLPR